MHSAMHSLPSASSTGSRWRKSPNVWLGGVQQTSCCSGGPGGSMLQWTSCAPTQQGRHNYPLECTRGAKHCNRAEASKLRENSGPCQAKGWGFSPFAVSTWGGLGTSAKAVLFEVSKRATSDLRGWPKTKALQAIREALSVTLMREVVRHLSLRDRVQEALVPW